MRVMIELGIFDDGDVLPTTCIMLAETDDLATIQGGVDILTGLIELRAAAEQEYGRAAPASALFWSCHPDPAALVANHRGGVDRSHEHDVGGES
jgi:hypothetical protein